jgi:hypothetical protein
VDISEAAAADKNKKITVGELLRGAPDGTAAAPGFAFESDGGNGIFLGGTDILAFSTGGSQAVTIDASQRVGIGTTSPDGTLHVNTASAGTITPWANADDLIVENNGPTGISIIAPDDEQAQIIFANPSDNIGSIIRWKRDENELQVGTHKTAGFLTFRTAIGVERARIDSSGRLLVGTSNGSGNSTAHFQGNAGASIGGAFISLQRGATNPSNGTELATISFADNAPSQGARIQAFTDGDWAASDYPGRLVFSTTADGASSPTERLRIDSSGRVGIGITSPVAALHVVTSGAGEIRHADGTRAVAMGSTGTISYIGSVTAGNGLALYSANEEKARIDSSGRLGIGTSSPGNYHPSYDNLVVGSTSTDSGVTIFSSTTGTGGLIFADGTSANDRIRSSITYSHANDLLNFSVNSGQSALVIDSSRRVGIGTASPAYKCDIDVTGSAVRLNSTTTGAALVISSDDAANAKIEFGDESDNDRGAITYDNPNNALIFQANAAERVRIESGGKTKFSGGAYGIERTATAAAFDLNTGNFWTCGAIAIPNPTNQVAGMMGSLRVTAAPTSFAANWKHPGGTYTAPTTFPAVAPFYVQASGTILLGSWTEGIA